MRWIGQLSDERRSRGTHKARAQANEEPPGNNHAKILRTALQQRTENDDDRPSEDWVSSAIFVCSIRREGQRDGTTDDLHVDHETEQGATRVIENYNILAISSH
jgi:hypothetical protein